MKILVLTNGFIMIVEDMNLVGNYITWSRGLNVRRYGKGAGLGRLAYGEPPTEGTDDFDPEPAGEVHELLCVKKIDIKPAAEARYRGLLRP